MDSTSGLPMRLGSDESRRRAVTSKRSCTRVFAESCKSIRRARVCDGRHLPCGAARGLSHSLWATALLLGLAGAAANTLTGMSASDQSLLDLEPTQVRTQATSAPRVRHGGQAACLPAIRSKKRMACVHQRARRSHCACVRTCARVLPRVTVAVAQPAVPLLPELLRRRRRWRRRRQWACTLVWCHWQLHAQAGHGHAAEQRV